MISFPLQAAPRSWRCVEVGVRESAFGWNSGYPEAVLCRFRRRDLLYPLDVAKPVSVIIGVGRFNERTAILHPAVGQPHLFVGDDILDKAPPCNDRALLLLKVVVAIVDGSKAFDSNALEPVAGLGPRRSGSRCG